MLTGFLHCNIIVADAVSSLYYGWLGFTTGSPLHEATTWPGRLIIVGFSFFFLIVFASFTASTAAGLIERDLASVEVRDLAGVIEQGGKVCILTAMRSSFVIRHPQFEGNVISDDDYTTLFQFIDDGKCLAMVVMQDVWEQAQAGKFPTTRNTGATADLNHCDKMSVGEAVMSVPNACPGESPLPSHPNNGAMRPVSTSHESTAWVDCPCFATAAVNVTGRACCST